MRLLISAVTAFAISGAAQAYERNATTEMAWVLDVQTSASKTQLAAATEAALRRYTSGLNVVTPLMMGPPPAEPGGLTIVDPLANSPLAGLAAFAGASAQGMRVAKCDGASFIAMGQRNISGAQSLRMTTCLFPYSSGQKQGYRLAMHVMDTHERGGNLSLMLGRAMANRVVGDPKTWTRRMVTDVIGSVEAAAAAPAVLIEGQPDLEGTRWSLANKSVAAPEPAAGAALAAMLAQGDSAYIAASGRKVLIVEVKGPLVFVQPAGEPATWVRLDELSRTQP
jgi:hypothetical protein